ncbi:MAG: hypothetical protein ACK5OB_06985 [Pirellula sp.]
MFRKHFFRVATIGVGILVAVIVFGRGQQYILREKISSSVTLTLINNGASRDGTACVKILTYPDFFIGTIEASLFSASSFSIFDRLNRFDSIDGKVTCIFDNSHEFVFVYLHEKDEYWIKAAQFGNERDSDEFGSRGTKRDVFLTEFAKIAESGPGGIKGVRPR